MIVTRDLSIDDYHASDRLSTSKLKTFASLGPMAYRARHLVAENRQEPTDAMLLGQAFEDFVQLDSATFASKWTEAPADEGKADDALLAEAAALTTEEGKPFTKRHGAATVRLAIMRSKGINVLARRDFQTIERMAASLDRNIHAQQAIKGALTQCSLIDEWPLDIIPGIQARPDWMHATGETVDLKSTAKFAAFDSEILNRGMHSQAAIIDMIAGVRERTLIACENVWPYRCQVISLQSAWLDLGRAWVDEQIAGLRVCYERDEWPLCATIRTSNPPAYLTRRLENDDG
jgi:hypothetical protein